MKILVKFIYWTLLLLGIVLRLVPYSINHSLWLDESLLTLNLIERNFYGLLQPLDYAQVVPVLFLLIEKTCANLFGFSEYALRLPPLLFGLAILPLSYHFTKIISKNVYAALVSLFLFATFPLLIFYSTEVRQYECDVFSTLCLFTIVFEPSLSGKGNKRYILLAVAGSALTFLSYTVIFELFIIGIYYLSKYRLKIFKQPGLLVVFAIWAMAFAINYIEFVYNSPYQIFMLNFWVDNFMPFNIFSLHFWIWLQHEFLPDFSIYWIASTFFFCLASVIFMIKKQWLLLYLLLFPLTLHLILSGFKIYPFEQRHNLYLCSYILPAISIGIVECIQIIKKRFLKYGVAVMLLSVLFYDSVTLLKSLGYPSIFMVHYPTEIRDCIDFINANFSSGQKVYVHYPLKSSLIYYTRIGRVKFEHNLFTEEDDWGHANPNKCYNDITSLHGINWLLFSNVPRGSDGDETHTLNLLEKSSHFAILKTYKAVGCSAYLVDLNSSN